MPPNVAPLIDGMNADFDRDRRDAEAYRQIGQDGWVLLRRSDLQEILDTLAVILAITGRVKAQGPSEVDG